MKTERIYASSVARLDSDVIRGGGTDDTAALQAVLDRANDQTGIYLIMDGAALVSHLVVHSHTTIECLNKSCGFFQIAHTNASIIANDNDDSYTLKSRDITVVGGTYNQNCLHQERQAVSDTPFAKSARKGDYVGEKIHCTFGMEFYGVEHLLVRDVTIRNFRTFAFTLGGFCHATIENCWLELPDHIQSGNQDGFHFWGPGRFLTVRNCGGRVGDDFMNIGPDERDMVSSITDVLVDGIFLDDADQAIRLLSRDKGRLDRVTIRNISGTYRSFGFYIMPWFQDDAVGDFGNIVIENVDLRSMKPNYDYRPAFLFSVGGNVESLIIKNVRCHQAFDNRQLFEFGVPFCGLPDDEKAQSAYGIPYKIHFASIEDLVVTEGESDPRDTRYIGVYGDMDHLLLRNITILKDQPEDNGALLSFGRRGRIKTLVRDTWHIEGVKTLITEPEKIDRVEKTP